MTLLPASPTPFSPSGCQSDQGRETEAGFASTGADRLVNKKTVFHAVMANTDCHPDRIQNQLGENPQAMPKRDYAARLTEVDVYTLTTGGTIPQTGVLD